VVGGVADDDRAVSAAHALRPDVIVLWMGDGLLVRPLAVGNHPQLVPVLVLVDKVELQALRTLWFGASGIVLTAGVRTDLVHALKMAHAGYLCVPDVALEAGMGCLPGWSTDADHLAVLQLLTLREREVLIRVARGLSSADIAADLRLSESTVKSHFARVMDKLGLPSRLAAVSFCYETGLVRVGRTG